MIDNASKFNIFFKYENKYLGRFPYYSKNMAYFELIISSRTNLFLFLNSGLWYVYLLTSYYMANKIIRNRKIHTKAFKRARI